MPRDWDDPWVRYPPSKPLPVEDGLATTKQRGPMALTWWSRRFVTVLESYGLGGRMQRGRRYARTGQVMSLEVRTALIAAQVQGSRRTPYVVTISLPEPTTAQWAQIDAAIAAKVGFAAQLLAGELPTELEEVFASAGVDLFPHSWTQVRAACSCPDWGNPCKHVAAVLYVFADRLDADPWLALAWRGRTREQVLERLRMAMPQRATERVAPWWPFAPGPLPSLDWTATSGSVLVAGEVLDRLEPLAVAIGRTPFTDLLGPVYDAIRSAVAGGDPPSV